MESNLDFFLPRIPSGLWNKQDLALKYFIEGLGTLDSFVSGMALWAPETRIQSYLNKVDRIYDRFYSLLATHYTGSNENSQKALQMHLNYKGRTTEILATRNRLALYSKDEKLVKKINDLKKITQELSMLSISGPSAGMTLDVYRWKIDTLNKQREQVEEDLAKGAAEFAEKKAVAKMTVNDVAAALPDGGTYIDFIEYDKFDYRTGNWLKEKHYLGFLLRRDTTGKTVVRIENLGAASMIDPVVQELRTILKSGLDVKRGVGGKRVINKADNAKVKGKTDVSEAGVKLYKALLSPFQKEIEQSKILCISPSGNLNLLPFEVISIPGGKEYIGDRIPVIYGIGRDIFMAKLKSKIAPAEKTLSNKGIIMAGPDFQKDKTTVTNVATLSKDIMQGEKLVRGDVRGWPMKFEALPGTLEEAKAIKKLAGPANVDVYTGADATEKAIKKVRNPRMLHVATHGFFLEDVNKDIIDNTRGVGGIRPIDANAPAAQSSKEPLRLHDPLLRSGLVFAGANRLAEGLPIVEGEEDGILTAAEVTGMDLNGTELVVLSACETGLGEVKRGNGVSGLRRSFKIAGAQNIIMSLWSVPDAETVWLMEAFYRNYFKGDRPAIALNKARATLRQKLIARDGVDHPFYWAAFVLEGSTM